MSTRSMSIMIRLEHRPKHHLESVKEHRLSGDLGFLITRH